MIAIGLGKQAGAQAYHSRGMQALAATVFAVASPRAGPPAACAPGSPRSRTPITSPVTWS